MGALLPSPLRLPGSFACEIRSRCRTCGRPQLLGLGGMRETRGARPDSGKVEEPQELPLPGLGRGTGADGGGGALAGPRPANGSSFLALPGGVCAAPAAAPGPCCCAGHGISAAFRLSAESRVPRRRSSGSGFIPGVGTGGDAGAGLMRGGGRHRASLCSILTPAPSLPAPPPGWGGSGGDVLI